MAILKWLAVVVIGLAALLFGGALLLPQSFTVVRSIVVAAPADKVWALLQDPREWRRWTAWNRRDPGMKISYSGPPAGAGAGWAWKSDREGEGRMSFTTVDPGRRLAYELYFPDWDSTSNGDLSLEPTPDGTRVRWTMHGNMGNSLIGRWFGLLGDRLVGPDFDAGLANLKAAAEKP
jgi:uncharacterized protein YndB with AHSA1/START domain